MICTVSIERAQNGFIVRDTNTGEARVAAHAMSIGREVEHFVHEAEIERIEIRERRDSQAKQFADDTPPPMEEFV